MPSVLQKQVSRVALAITLLLAIAAGLGVSGMGITLVFRGFAVNLLLVPAIAFIGTFLMLSLHRRPIVAYCLATVGLLVNGMFDRIRFGRIIGPGSAAGAFEGVGMLLAYVAVAVLVVRAVHSTFVSTRNTTGIASQTDSSWIWLVALIIWVAVANLWRPIGPAGLWAMFNRLLLVLLFIVLCHLFSTNSTVIRPIMVVVLATALVVSLLSLPTALLGIPICVLEFEWPVGRQFVPFWWTTGGVLHNPNLLARVVTFGIGSAAILWFDEQMRVHRKWLVLAFMVFGFTLLQTSSRSSILASIIIIAWTFRRDRRVLLGIVLSAALLWLAESQLHMGLFYKYHYSSLADALEASERTWKWQLSIELIQSNPVFGIGVDRMYMYNSPHNSYLVMALSYGIPAVVLTLAFVLHAIVSGFLRSGRELNASLQRIRINAIGVVVGFCALSVFEIGLLTAFDLYDWFFITFLGIIASRSSTRMPDFLAAESGNPPRPYMGHST